MRVVTSCLPRSNSAYCSQSGPVWSSVGYLYDKTPFVPQRVNVSLGALSLIWTTIHVRWMWNTLLLHLNRNRKECICKSAAVHHVLKCVLNFDWSYYLQQNNCSCGQGLITVMAARQLYDAWEQHSWHLKCLKYLLSGLIPFYQYHNSHG